MPVHVAHKGQTVLLLGAGFSKWSCDLPLVSELFDFKVHPDNLAEEKRVARLQKHYDSWKRANPHSNNEEFVRYSQAQPNRFNLTNWYVTRRLCEPFIVQRSRRYTWYVNSYHPRNHKGIRKANDIIEAVQQSASLPVGIITTNYDLIPEYVLGTRRFNYGKDREQIGYTPYPYPAPLYTAGEIAIAKLHGSISWDHDRKYPDCRCGLTGKCLIVPPIAEKKAPKILRQQWSLARSLLSACKKLVVFGFAFNAYDKAICSFFTKHIPLTSKVILVDLVDHRPRLKSILLTRHVEYIYANDGSLIEKLKSPVD